MADTAATMATLSKSKVPDRLPHESDPAWAAFQIFAVLRNLAETRELYDQEYPHCRNSWRINKSWPWCNNWFERVGVDPLPNPQKLRSAKPTLPAPIAGAPIRLPGETDVAYYAFSLFWKNVKTNGTSRALAQTEDLFRQNVPHKRHKIHTWKIAHNWWERVGHPEQSAKAAEMAAALDKLNQLKEIGDAHNADTTAFEILEKMNQQQDLSDTPIPNHCAQFRDLSDYTIDPIPNDVIKRVRDVAKCDFEAPPPPQTRTIKLDVLAQTLLELAQAQQQQAIEELTAQLIELEEMLEVTDKILSTPSNGAIPPNLLAAISKLPIPAKHYSTGVRAARRALDLLAGIIK